MNSRISLALIALPFLLRADAPALHSIRDIASCAFHGTRISRPFDCTNQIFLICDSRPRRLCLLGTEHPYTHNFLLQDDRSLPYQCGDLVHVQGSMRAIAPASQRDLQTHGEACITNLTIVGKAPWPQTTAATARDLDPHGPHRFVQVRGTVGAILRDATNAEWNWIILRTESGTVRAAVTEHDYPYASLKPLVDAEVRLKGITHEFTAWRSFLGQHVILFGADGIDTLRPAPDPFAATELESEPAIHRQIVRGTVVGLSSSHVFIRDSKERFLVLTPQEGQTLPSVGSRITASGFATLASMGYEMTEAVIRTDGLPDGTALPNAETIDSERMFSTACGKEVADAALYGRLIRLRGTVANSRDSIQTDGHVILECGSRTITVDVRHLTDVLDDIPSRGYEIDVSGICLSDFKFDATNLAFPQFRGFLLVPRTSDDIAIRSHPPWWTPLRLLCVIVILAVFIVAILVWNRALKVLSERRGRELYREQLTSAKADLKVEERTRLAIELHDSISQTLTGVALQIDAAAKTGHANSSDAGRFLETARAMLASCRQELRCCIWDLKSRTFDEKDMAEAVQRTLAPHIGNAELQIRFNVPRKMLSESAAHDTLRIIRELAVNALRHGKARHLRIAGEYKDGYVRFSVRDDGTGFDSATVPGPTDGHFGLQGIRERIKDRNGQLKINSAVGKGTKITVTLMAGGKDDDEK